MVQIVQIKSYALTSKRNKAHIYVGTVIGAIMIKSNLPRSGWGVASPVSPIFPITWNRAMDRVKRCSTETFVRVISNEMIANRIHVAAEGSGESSFLNSLTAIDGHDRQRFNKLRGTGTVVSRRVFIHSQSLIARWTRNDLILAAVARDLYEAWKIDDVSRGSKSYLFWAS